MQATSAPLASKEDDDAPPSEKSDGSIAESIGSDDIIDDDFDEDDFEDESGDDESRFGVSDVDPAPVAITETAAPIAIAAQGGALVEGMRVVALYDGGPDYYPGKITRKHPNGTFDILYDDGDSESELPATMVKANAGASIIDDNDGDDASVDDASVQSDISIEDGIDDDVKSSIQSGTDEYDDDDYEDDSDFKTSSAASSHASLAKPAEKRSVPGGHTSVAAGGPSSSSFPPKQAVLNKIQAIANQASVHDDLYAESSTESYHHTQKSNAEQQVAAMVQTLKHQNKQLDLRAAALEEERARCLQTIESRLDMGASMYEIETLREELADRVQDGMAKIELDRSAVQLRHQKQLLELKKGMRRPMRELEIGHVPVPEVSSLADFQGMREGVKAREGAAPASLGAKTGAAKKSSPRTVATKQDEESVVYSDFSQSESQIEVDTAATKSKVPATVDPSSDVDSDIESDIASDIDDDIDSDIQEDGGEGSGDDDDYEDDFDEKSMSMVSEKAPKKELKPVPAKQDTLTGVESMSMAEKSLQSIASSVQYGDDDGGVASASGIASEPQSQSGSSASQDSGIIQQLDAGLLAAQKDLDGFNRTKLNKADRKSREKESKAIELLQRKEELIALEKQKLALAERQQNAAAVSSQALDLDVHKAIAEVHTKAKKSATSAAPTTRKEIPPGDPPPSPFLRIFGQSPLPSLLLHH